MKLVVLAVGGRVGGARRGLRGNRRRRHGGVMVLSSKFKSLFKLRRRPLKRAENGIGSLRATLADFCSPQRLGLVQKSEVRDRPDVVFFHEGPRLRLLAVDHHPVGARVRGGGLRERRRRMPAMATVVAVELEHHGVVRSHRVSVQRRVRCLVHERLGTGLQG